MSKTVVPSHLGGVGSAGLVTTSGSETQVTAGAGLVYVSSNTPLNYNGSSLSLVTFAPTGTNWNSVMIGLNSSGVLVGVAGTENSAKGSVVDGAFAVDNLPLARVFIQGNGGGGINSINVSDVSDYRPLFNLGGGGGVGGEGSWVFDEVETADSTIAVNTVRVHHSRHYSTGATTTTTIRGTLLVIS